jgi:hypothetical protein
LSFSLFLHFEFALEVASFALSALGMPRCACLALPLHAFILAALACSFHR